VKGNTIDIQRVIHENETMGLVIIRMTDELERAKAEIERLTGLLKMQEPPGTSPDGSVTVSTHGGSAICEVTRPSP